MNIQPTNIPNTDIPGSVKKDMKKYRKPQDYTRFPQEYNIINLIFLIKNLVIIRVIPLTGTKVCGLNYKMGGK